MNYIKLYENFNTSGNLTENEENIIQKYIIDNELDYSITGGQLFRYSLTLDGICFYVNKSDGKYVLIKHDPMKEVNDPNQFIYLNYESLDSMLEDLKVYENSIPKSYWSMRLDSAQVDFIKESYNPVWYEEFINEDFRIEDYEKQYKYITYTKHMDFELKNPYNDHELSNYKLEKMYFEIHPVCVERGKEEYLAKFLVNNDPIFKEYISYDVYKRKGLKMFVESLLDLC